jgi:hypothetical protein
VKCLDEQQLEIPLQLLTCEGDALINRRIELLVEENNKLRNYIERSISPKFHKLTIITNIHNLHYLLQTGNPALLHDYLSDFDLADLHDEYVQYFYNVFANCSQVTVYKALADRLDPNYPITVAPRDGTAESRIVPNAGMEKMHTLFTRKVHYLMNQFAAGDNGYNGNISGMYNNAKSYFPILNILINKANLAKLLCGTNKPYPAAGTIKQLADRWFEPMIQHIKTLEKSDENQQNMDTLVRLKMATYL